MLPQTSAASRPENLPTDGSPAPSTTRTVLWDGIHLEVRVNNVGLNSLLQEIATRTGTRLTGSVPEERIFGTYGPGTLDAVLSKLLEGVPVNVMLVDHTGKERRELLLTVRNGGVTPPSPASAARSFTPPEPSPARPGAGYGGSRPEGNFAGGPSPQGSGGGPGSSAVPASAGAPLQDQDATQTTASDGTPSTVNGVKSPQEIYEQLQRLRALQTQSQTPATQ